jgi:hypothetical protein
MTRDVIMKLAGRGMDKAIALAMDDVVIQSYGWADSVMPANDPDALGVPLRDYSNNAEDIRWMEFDIERMGLTFGYVKNLATLLDYVSDDGVGFLFPPNEAFQLMTASPELKCKAALLAVMDAQERDVK